MYPRTPQMRHALSQHRLLRAVMSALRDAVTRCRARKSALRCVMRQRAARLARHALHVWGRAAAAAVLRASGGATAGVAMAARASAGRANAALRLSCARVRQLRAVATVQAVFRAWAAATKQARYDALAVCACRQRACSACLRAWGVTCMHVAGSRRGSDYAMRDRPQWPPRTAGCDRRAARLARCRTRCTSAPARGGGGDGCRRGLDRIGCGEARRREPDT